MWDRERPPVFDLTGAAGDQLTVIPMWAECAPRGSALMAAIGQVMSGGRA